MVLTAHLSSPEKALYIYNEARKWFPLVFSLASPVLFIINAPFGRFTLQNQSNKLLVDGRISWIIMELPSPLLFLYTYLRAPLTSNATQDVKSLNAQTILVLAFLIHYANRAIISPLRTPSRSKSHLVVPLAAIIFNVLNGSLMGTYLSSPSATSYLSGAQGRVRFWMGLAIWAVGLAGNIYHDEILLDIRRSKTKAGSRDDDDNGKQKQKGEHYAIPQGGLYTLISYPNYFCEWVEWFGFALAAAPFPLSFPSLSSLSPSSVLDLATWAKLFTTPAHGWFPTFSPPWIFLYVSIVVMYPRAVRGHEWYHTKFGARYPKERRAVVPFVA